MYIVGVKGGKVNILGEKRQFLSWRLKKGQNFCLENRTLFRKIWNFFGWSRKVLRPDSRPPRLRTRLTPLTLTMN